MEQLKKDDLIIIISYSILSALFSCIMILLSVYYVIFYESLENNHRLCIYWVIQQRICLTDVGLLQM